jgi:hypothetical protein
MPYDAVIVRDSSLCGPDGWPLSNCNWNGVGWWPALPPTESPWLTARVPMKRASCWVVACGPQLLRVADAE